MKNIEQILTDNGITVTADQLTAINKDVNDNYKTIADYNKQKDKLATAEDKVNTLTASLDKFKGVDPEALNKQITDLQDQLKQKDTEYSEKIAARDFDELLKDAIGSAKGRNAKAIKALLDLDTLKQSKNQKDDVAAALKQLAEAEDSSFLFDQAKADDDDGSAGLLGKADVIGSIKGGSGDNLLSGMRAAMGLPASAKPEK